MGNEWLERQIEEAKKVSQSWPEWKQAALKIEDRKLEEGRTVEADQRKPSKQSK